MAAALTDKFKKAGASTVTSLAAPGKAIGATSITVGSTTNYPLDTGVVVAIRVVDTAGALVAGTYTEWNAIVTSATSFTLDPTPVHGSDQVYAAGSSTQVYISVSSSAHNQLVDGLLVSHNQDGSQRAGTITNGSLSTTSGELGGAWTTWATTVGGFSSTTDATLRYMLIGKTVHIRVYINGTSNATSFSFTVPYAVANGGSVPCRIANNGVTNTSPGLIDVSGSTLFVYTSLAGAAWTASGQKILYPTVFTYEAA